MRLTFFLVFVLAVQPFSWVAAKSLLWLLQGRLKTAGKRLVWLAVFGIGNGLLLVSALRWWPGAFRLTAAWLVLLLYILFAALMTLFLWRLLRGRVAAARLSRWLRLFAPLSVAALFAVSVYLAYTPSVRHYEVVLDKPLAKPLRIGVASDLHLGRLVGARQLDKLVRIMNDEKVDIILLPGDLMDDNTEAYEAENMRPHLAALRAPLGVYATLGNHDLFGAENAIRRALRDAGIVVLDDEAVEVDGRFTVVGRPDKLAHGRAQTADLLAKADTAKPVLLLDHRPDDVEAHAALPVDIQVSGHVHKGQVFPANLLVQAINRLSYGYEAIGNGHFFVTSGYGFWGVPFRLGSQAEVLVIDVRGKP